MASYASVFDSSRFVRTTQPDGGELASKIVSLFSITVMSVLFGIKTFNVQFRYLSYSRWLVLLLYVLSWAFTMCGTLFVFTNNGNFTSCLLSELTCDIFYSGTKIMIYCWLIEKVWVVSPSRQSRWNTKSYRFHCLLLTPYIAIFTLMIVFHIAELEEDGTCIIGLQPIASIPLIVYDFVFNFYMTILFVKPLINSGEGVRADWKTSRLRNVARRTLLASIVSLLVSLANVLALAILNGRERGVLCLTCCTVDVTINVVTIHWVTTNTAPRASKEIDTNDLSANRTDPNLLQVYNDEDNFFKSFKDNNQVMPPSKDKPYEPHFVHQEAIKVSHEEEEETMSIQESHSSRKSLTKK